LTPTPKHAGFTLLEVILVLMLIAIVSGISVPQIAGTLRGSKLRAAARTIERASRYGRNMAIIREEPMTLVLNSDTMELFVGGAQQSATNTADGELDQSVLKRLGYIDGEASDSGSLGIEQEIHRFLSDDLMVQVFEKEWTEEDDPGGNVCLVRFYPNGQGEWFELVLEDNRGSSIRLENDPITGKVWTEFLQ
jgi:type II secretion system protein H